MYDELELDTLGDKIYDNPDAKDGKFKKTALFLIMSDTDSTFNFLISMIYSQLFNLLCEKADDQYKARLPVHVRCLIDEAANIGQIPNLEKLMATIRSREISACLVLQAQSQLKALYKDNADTIIGNCDTSIFLGGKEPTTLKELNQALGKETIDTFNTGESRGREVSHSLNYQKLAKTSLRSMSLLCWTAPSASCSFEACDHFCPINSISRSTGITNACRTQTPKMNLTLKSSSLTGSSRSRTRLTMSLR